MAIYVFKCKRFPKKTSQKSKIKSGDIDKALIEEILL